MGFFGIVMRIARTGDVQSDRTDQCCSYASHETSMTQGSGNRRYQIGGLNWIISKDIDRYRKSSKLRFQEQLK